MYLTAGARRTVGSAVFLSVHIVSHFSFLSSEPADFSRVESVGSCSEASLPPRGGGRASRVSISTAIYLSLIGHEAAAPPSIPLSFANDSILLQPAPLCTLSKNQRAKGRSQRNSDLGPGQEVGNPTTFVLCSTFQTSGSRVQCKV